MPATIKKQNTSSIAIQEAKDITFTQYLNLLAEMSGCEDEEIGFKKLQSKIEAEGKSPEAAAAIAASIGRKKYGKAKFQKMAAAGKK